MNNYFRGNLLQGDKTYIFSVATQKHTTLAILRPFGDVLRRFQSYLNKTKHFTLLGIQGLYKSIKVLVH